MYLCILVTGIGADVGERVGWSFDIVSYQYCCILRMEVVSPLFMCCNSGSGILVLSDFKGLIVVLFKYLRLAFMLLSVVVGRVGLGWNPTRLPG